MAAGSPAQSYASFRMKIYLEGGLAERAGAAGEARQLARGAVHDLVADGALLHTLEDLRKA
eukprot:scaffold4598_cov100-Isochrysis_galbana.AAC.3